jgi:hypothetical protein
VYTLSESEKANDVEQYEYLVRVFTYLPGFGKTLPAEKMETLLPWHSAMQT